MNITFLTNGSSHGRSIIQAMHAHGIQIHSVVLEKKTLGAQELKVFEDKLGRFVRFVPFKRLFYKLYRSSKYNDLSVKELKQYTQNITEVNNLNDVKTQDTLTKGTPDIIVLGGARIIKDHIIKIARVGVLNAHPGILPKYRGLDVAAWAIHNNEEVGVTVHKVNEGIDTGEICLKKTIDAKEHHSLEEVKDALEKLAGEMVVKVLQEYIEEGQLHSMPNAYDSDVYFKKMPQNLKLAVQKKLAKGG